MNSARIANELSARGKQADAVKILDKVKAGITEHSYLYDFTAYYMAGAYYRAGARDKARDMAGKLIRNCEDDINYISNLDDGRKPALAGDAQRDMTLIYIMSNIAQASGDSTSAHLWSQKVQTLQAKIGGLIQQQQQQQQQ